MKTISVITVNLNNKEGLEETLKSIRVQSYPKLEHIVIDGGSTDGSLDIIRQHEKNIAYWISESDKGIYHAMNKGIEVAAGDYLLFLNSGDRLNEPDTISAAEAELKDADIVYGNIIPTGSNKDMDRWKPGPFTLFDFYKSTLPHSSTFVRKQVILELGKYNEKYMISSDFDFFLRAFLSGKYSFRYIDVDISVFNKEGISNKPENKKIVEKERRNIIETNFPEAVLPDYDRLFKYSRAETAYGRYGLIWAMNNRIVRDSIHFLYRLLKRTGICVKRRCFWENT